MSQDKYPQASLDSKTQAMIEAGNAIREAGGLAVAEAGKIECILDQAGGANYNADPSGHRELSEQGFVSYVSPEEREARRKLQAMADKPREPLFEDARSRDGMFSRAYKK